VAHWLHEAIGWDVVSRGEAVVIALEVCRCRYLCGRRTALKRLSEL